MKETIKKSFLGGIVFSLTTITAIVAYASIGSTWTSPDTQEVGSGDTLTSTSWNNLQANFNNIDTKITSLTTNYSTLDSTVNSVSATATQPAGAIMAFKLASCPEGWVVADGTNSTPDLRGAFLRGMSGNSNGRDVARTLGDYQTDDFKSHTHQYSNNPSGRTIREGGSLNNSAEKGKIGYTRYNTTAVGGTETRPKNVAVLFCMKQ